MPSRFRFSGLIAWSFISWSSIVWPLIAPPAPLHAQTPGWTSLGPFGGTVSTLLPDPADPRVLYAAGSFFHVLKSVDAGASWMPLTGSPSGIDILVLVPAHPTAVYAVSSGRVFKSSDGGAHWAPVGWTGASGDLPGEEVAVVAVDPRDSRTVYAGMGAGFSGEALGVWKSTDSGASWQPTGLGEQIVTALAASPLTGVLWASGLGGRVFRSGDGGANWQDRSGGLELNIQDFAFNTFDPGRVYAAGFGGIWSFTDNP